MVEGLWPRIPVRSKAQRMKALTCLPSPSALSPPLKWTRLEGERGQGRFGVEWDGGGEVGHGETHRIPG